MNRQVWILEIEYKTADKHLYIGPFDGREKCVDFILKHVKTDITVAFWWIRQLHNPE